MPESVPQSIARLLSLVAWIGDHPGATVDDVARHFDRSRRQVRRDVEYLGGVGDSLPGRSFEVDWDLYEREQRLAIRTTLGADLPPRLTQAEATAILIGLHAISDGLDADLRARLPKIAMAIRSLNPGADDEALIVTGDRAHDLRLATLTRALGEGRRVAFDYRSKDSRTSSRVVEPWRVRLGADGWLMSGWCTSAGEPRTFRVDAMSGLTVLDETIEHREDEGVQAPTTARLRIRAGAQWIIEQYGARVVAEHEDSTCDVEVDVWDEAWLTSLLIDIAPDLVDAPEDRVGVMRSTAARALEVWRAAPAGEGIGS